MNKKRQEIEMLPKVSNTVTLQIKLATHHANLQSMQYKCKSSNILLMLVSKLYWSYYLSSCDEWRNTFKANSIHQLNLLSLLYNVMISK